MVITANDLNSDAQPIKRKSLTSVIKEAPFYPDLAMEKDEAIYIGEPLIIWDSVVRDWQGEFGQSQYCLFKASKNKPGEEGNCFLFKLGGVAIVNRVRKALAKRLLPSKEGLSAVIALQTSESGRAYYNFVDLG